MVKGVGKMRTGSTEASFSGRFTASFFCLSAGVPVMNVAAPVGGYDSVCVVIFAIVLFT